VRGLVVKAARLFDALALALGRVLVLACCIVPGMVELVADIVELVMYYPFYNWGLDPNPVFLVL
jgi:hypothetical protein